MDPATGTTLGVRLASTAVAPLIKKLFAPQAPGAALVDEPVRISSLVSFCGERHTLTSLDLERLAAELVRRAVRAAGPNERPVPVSEEDAVAHAVAAQLRALGGISMDDVQAVRLGPRAFARELRLHSPRAARHLSADGTELCKAVVETACLHILNHFTQRSTFVPRTLVEQSRQLADQTAVLDLLIERLPSQSAEDARFEELYADHIVRKHGELTIYGLDLNHAREWPLDAAYISLEASHAAGAPQPAERALAGHDRVLLRGSAGSGKTTMVQWLALTAARQSYDPHLAHLVGRVPFVLPLRRVMRDGLPPTPDRFLHATRSGVAGDQPPGWANRVLRGGRGLLLVDGIDEIPEREREETRRWLRELMGEFPGNLWLVTCRPSAVRQDWLAAEEFAELTLAPMSRADVAGFVRRWHTAAEADPELADALLTAVRLNGDLGSLAVNPLMCGLLCALHRERRGFLPHSRKDLYDAALSMLLERRDAERAVTAAAALPLSKETQVQLLQKLAHWMMRNDRAEMDRTDAVERLAHALRNMTHIEATPERVFRHLLDRSGLLREPAADRVDFVHRTFQDYLAGKAAVEEGDFPLLIDNADNDQWADVIQMAVAHARPAERARIVRGVLAEETSIESGDPLPFRRVALAAACVKHATEIDADVVRKVDHNTRVMLPPGSISLAIAIAESAGPLLLGLLPGPEGLAAHEAEAVVIAASRIATDAALPILARFREHPSLAVRRQLSWAWHRFDTDAYADEIIAHLPDDDLYFAVPGPEHLRALRRLGGRSHVQVIGPWMSHEYEPADFEGVTHVWVRDDFGRVDIGWLANLPHLHTLVLPDSPAVDAELVPSHVTVLPAPEDGLRVR
ncbi:NACHT domain-containing protein [Streptomyces armeniacus]|uniref:NACHT domain-containing protein n=1 Tax=Streptomyces armeniacus TaxID=83291 RepID=A0A345XWW7_9ACTN|nr:NACHT domain-containing protein [Streptomyces armeniacus]AXK36133.1 NACHT domain-containing protein [Streptomyces armeniacus]